MSPLSFLYLLVFLFYLWLITFVFFKNSGSTLNRVCALVISCFAIWNLSDLVITIYPHPTFKTLAYVSLGWCSFPSFALWFLLIFTKKKKILKHWIIYPILLVLPLFFIYKQWEGCLIIDFVTVPYGRTIVWSQSIWKYAYFTYYNLFILIGLYLCFDFMRKTDKVSEKKQAKIIFVTCIITLVVGSIANVILPELKIYILPNIASILVLIWAIGLVYAITKYGFMTITPAAAAENILATMADSLILINPEKYIIRVNKATLDLLGFKEEELVGKPIDTIVEEKSPFSGEQFERLIQDGQIRDYNMEYRTKSRETIPISFSASVMYDKQREMIGIVGVAKDLRQIGQLIKELQQERASLDIKVKERTIELEKLNQELKNSEERLKILFEFAPDAYYLNDFKGNFIDGNKAAEEVTGYKREELIGKNFLNLKLLPLAQLPKAAAVLAKNVLGQPSGPDEFTLNRKDGGQVVLEIRTYPVKIKDKTLVLGIAHDVTGRKRAEEELRNTYNQLKEAQVELIQSAKMAAVGQLGAGVAHELNNPLGGILGYAQFVLEKLKRPEFGTEDFKGCSKYLESIEHEAARCKGIVENLLKFSRRPISAKPEVVDIAAAINETISIIGHQLKLKNIKLTLDIKPDLSGVLGILNQLQQVFANLILNAQQAMSESGELKITAYNILDEKTKTPTHVRIEFSDTGCGISEENLAHLFEPFFTTKQKEKGTGLGLAVSYQIIQDHKGTLEVTSQVGKGTTITITLPAAGGGK